MAKPVRIAVMGAGLIGKRHIEHVLASDRATLSAIVDPTPVGKILAEQHRVPWFRSFAEMVTHDKPEGVIIATPNQVHVANGIDAVSAGIPVLVEKPIADDVASGLKLVEAAEKAKVPLLTGHHRRHNLMIQRAKAIIDSGKLGRIITVHGFFWLSKPAAYFEPQWRREKGAGPVFMNLIHDVDLLRYLVGEISSVIARESNAVRGNAVEDVSVMLLSFANGALGTVNVSDSVVAPWSWEQTTGENPVYPHTDQTCYFIGGTHGSLTVPRLEFWSNVGERSWWEPFTIERTIASDADPLRLQVDHFARVIRGEEAPLVSGREGLQTLKVIEAVKISARSGQSVTLT
ncbi:MAG: Gfo/Idh/MocA family oxidoreductase [Hyphomicrobiaceae bacterium]|nr:Gfo/Idh/MocA family oxidoreductase [Hyphomicrobiaceae bacterium]